ncbi:MAG: hypothetical protein RL136_560 [Planctomycetota bacterium]|jgi:competence protein ComEA
MTSAPRRTGDRAAVASDSRRVDGERHGIAVAALVLACCLVRAVAGGLASAPSRHAAGAAFVVPAVVVPAVRIDLNRASVDELALLPEVGPSLASEIVADRATRGAFASVEELTRVRGIGPSVLAALSAHARVSELRAP